MSGDWFTPRRPARSTGPITPEWATPPTRESGPYPSRESGESIRASWEPPRRPRRRRGIAFLPFAGAVVIALLVGAGVYVFSAAHDGGCSGSSALTLHVSVTPDLASAVKSTVSAFDDQRQSVSGHCVNAVVDSADPAAVATLLSGQGVSQGQTASPDVWIPDSSLWADLVLAANKKGATLRPTGVSVAKTPLVVAMPKALVTKLSKTGMMSNPSWDNLLTAAGGTAGGAETKNQLIPAGMIHLTLPDPTRNAIGMSTLVLTNELLASDPNKDTIFTGIVRTALQATTPTQDAEFTNFKANARGQYPVALASEQEVWKHNESGTDQPAVAIYPQEGSTMLDYPVEVTTADSSKARAAALLAKALSSPATQNRVKALGYRTATGEAPSSFGASSGVSAAHPRELPTPDAATVAGVMQAWQKLTLKMRMLTVYDISNTMSAIVPGTGENRLQNITRVAQSGLALLDDQTEIGVWEFSSKLDGKKPYKVLIPMGPLNQQAGSVTRRDLIQNGLAALQVDKGSNTSLYESLLAAYGYMVRTYEPDRINSMVVFTNGTDHLPGGLSIAATLKKIKALSDPAKPVELIIIGFGNNADHAELKQLTSATEGGAYLVQTPQEIAKILLEAISKRICNPKCSTG